MGFFVFRRKKDLSIEDITAISCRRQGMDRRCNFEFSIRREEDGVFFWGEWMQEGPHILRDRMVSPDRMEAARALVTESLLHAFRRERKLPFAPDRDPAILTVRLKDGSDRTAELSATEERAFREFFQSLAE